MDQREYIFDKKSVLNNFFFLIYTFPEFRIHATPTIHVLKSPPLRSC